MRIKNSQSYFRYYLSKLGTALTKAGYLDSQPGWRPGDLHPSHLLPFEHNKVTAQNDNLLAVRAPDFSDPVPTYLAWWPPLVSGWSSSMDDLHTSYTIPSPGYWVVVNVGLREPRLEVKYA